MSREEINVIKAEIRAIKRWIQKIDSQLTDLLQATTNLIKKLEDLKEEEI